MKTDLKPFGIAALGLLLAVVFFLGIERTGFVQNQQLQVSRAELVAHAESLRRASPLADAALDQEFDIDINKELVRFAGRHGDETPALADLPAVRYRVRWSGVMEDESGEEKSASLTARYDRKGRLLTWSYRSPLKNESPNLDEEAAMQAALAFLHEHGTDTTRLVLKDKTLNRKDGVVTCGFDYELLPPPAPRAANKIQVTIAGSQITRFSNTIDIERGAADAGGAENVLTIVIRTVTVLLWIAIGVVFLITFLTRIRHDEIEFNRARWIGAGIGLLLASSIAISAWPSLEGMLIGGGLAGLFVGAAAAFAFAAAESSIRRVWPEKLVACDLVFRGYVRVKEVGASMLLGLGLAGGALALLLVAVFAANTIGIAWLELDSDALNPLAGWRELAGGIGNGLVGIFFFTTGLAAFWPAWLRQQLQTDRLFFLALGASILFAGTYGILLGPQPAGLLFALPLVALLTYGIYRTDIVAIFTGAVVFVILVDLSYLVLLPEAITGTIGVTLMSALVLILLVGAALLASRESAAGIGHYVPAYVSRIAERERMLKELEIARRIQQQFLPLQNPEFPGLDISSICRPAMEVGGDYYDFHPDGERYLSVVVGDVSGKGVSAAFYMTMAKGILKTIARKIRAPRLVLSEMNAVFFENSAREVFISAIYGLFDLRERTLSFARAGHNPLVMYKSSGGTSEFLNPAGLAIGLEAGTVFTKTIEETKIGFGTGDVFVFYTDGLSESMDNDGEEFGEERLAEIINAHSDKSASSLLDVIRSEVDRFADGAAQHDDFTMVIVKIGDEVADIASRGEDAAASLMQDSMPSGS